METSKKNIKKTNKKMTKRENKIVRIRSLLLLLSLFFFVSFSSEVKAKTTVVSMDNVQTISGGKFVKKSNGEWVYKKKDGKLIKNSIADIKGKRYYFSKSGYRQYGWQNIKEKYYYFGKKTEGYMYKKQWLTLGSNRYYLKVSGVRAVGWLTTTSGKKYYFDSNGRMVRGNQKIDEENYYFDSSGKLLYKGANFKLSSTCAILVDANSGEVLYAKNEQKAHANASTTKIMTCILALEKGSLSDKVKISANAVNLSSRAAKIGIKKKDLLYALMLPSANDAAVALAEYTSGSTKSFVKKMNQKARNIGCKNTNFATPHGLDGGLNHYSTAYDLSKMTMYALRNSMFREIIGTSSYRFKSQKGYSYNCKTKNELLGKMPGMIGGKTGYTRKAGNCFVGIVTGKNGNTYISVTLGATTEKKRWDDTKVLLNYAYNL